MPRYRIKKRKRHLKTVSVSILLAIIASGLFYFYGRGHYFRGKVSDGTAYAQNFRLQADRDGDGIDDLDDIEKGAESAVEARPVYKSGYYQGGYPPDGEGVCTDIIWKAFKSAGYDLKGMVDSDIREHPRDYPAVVGKPDPNIDFRRVRNLYVFFKKYASNLTTKLIPFDPENLKQWQSGDIITFDDPGHIAILSSKRGLGGVPYMLHSTAPYARESGDLLYWMPHITGHFRYPKK